MDFECTHPAHSGEREEFQDLPGGGVMVGGVDGYATFCEPVDMHLTSLGETSRYIIEVEFREIDNPRRLPPGS